MTTLSLSQEFSGQLAPEDFWILLSEASGKPKEFLLAHPEEEFDPATEATARAFFTRRIEHEPVAYIVGEKEFYGLPFRVTKDTLIPRPETEQIVELAISELRSRIKNKEPSTERILIADIGTGSGAIIIALAYALKRLGTRYELHATDISEKALLIARENAKRNGVDDLISFHEGDILEPVKHFFDDADAIIITANLPYLSHKLYESTDADVKQYEPRSALESGKNGLDHYQTLFAQLKDARQNDKPVTVFCEISPEQEQKIERLALETSPETATSAIDDLSGRKRVFVLRLNKPR